MARIIGPESAPSIDQPHRAQVIRLADVPRQRWRNGGGWTRELLALPRAQDWRVRVSVAEIESDGPFSAFEGVERWIAVLAGQGIELTVDGTPHRLTATDAPLRFSGATATTCVLIDGPTRDLNLMLRDARGALTRAHSGESFAPERTNLRPLCCRAGPLLRRWGGPRPAGESLLWFDSAPAALRFEVTQPVSDRAAGWWITATATGQGRSDALVPKRAARRGVP